MSDQVNKPLHAMLIMGFSTVNKKYQIIYLIRKMISYCT